FNDISISEVKDIIDNLDVKKGAKNDLNAIIIKRIWDYDNNIILSILKYSLKLGVVPNCLKTSIVTPIPKIKNSNNVEHFRPINTLPILEQILEQLVKTQLEKQIEDNNILDLGQSGFRKYFSCESALQDSLTKWRKNLDDGFWIGVIFIDFVRAFETIDRNVLIELLQKLGLREIVLDWFISYLENRKQKVKFGNSLSDEMNVDTGVPQGSKLGPLLFIIYVNEIINMFKNVGIDCKLFADDMALYFASKIMNRIVEKLNSGLEILLSWLKDKQLEINLKKNGLYVDTLSAKALCERS
ncbi:GSCOCG00012414001-RA-CDS, partial [Cotesia congregata]